MSKNLVEIKLSPETRREFFERTKASGVTWPESLHMMRYQQRPYFMSFPIEGDTPEVQVLPAVKEKLSAIQHLLGNPKALLAQFRLKVMEFEITQNPETIRNLEMMSENLKYINEGLSDISPHLVEPSFNSKNGLSISANSPVLEIHYQVETPKPWFQIKLLEEYVETLEEVLNSSNPKVSIISNLIAFTWIAQSELEILVETMDIDHLCEDSWAVPLDSGDGKLSSASKKSVGMVRARLDVPGMCNFVLQNKEILKLSKGEEDFIRAYEPLVQEEYQ
jgi:hypothetical protein